jgi:hypothetical protein
MLGMLMRCRYIRWLWALARRFLAKLVFYRLRGTGGKRTAYSSDNFSEESTYWMLRVDSEFKVGKAYTLGLGCLEKCML